MTPWQRIFILIVFFGLAAILLTAAYDRLGLIEYVFLSIGILAMFAFGLGAIQPKELYHASERPSNND